MTHLTLRTADYPRLPDTRPHLPGLSFEADADAEAWSNAVGNLGDGVVGLVLHSGDVIPARILSAATNAKGERGINVRPLDDNDQPWVNVALFIHADSLDSILVYGPTVATR